MKSLLCQSTCKSCSITPFSDYFAKERHFCFDMKEKLFWMSTTGIFLFLFPKVFFIIIIFLLFMFCCSNSPLINFLFGVLLRWIDVDWQIFKLFLLFLVSMAVQKSCVISVWFTSLAVINYTDSPSCQIKLLLLKWRSGFWVFLSLFGPKLHWIEIEISNLELGPLCWQTQQDIQRESAQMNDVQTVPGSCSQ